MRLQPKWVFWGSIGFIFAGIGIAVASEQLFRHWPLGTWRVDMDDFLTSIGAIGVGVGAFMQGRAALHRANEAHDKADTNGKHERELEQREETDIAGLHERVRDLEAEWLRFKTPGGD